MTLAGVYSFWKYVSKLERRETRRYLEMFYILKFRDLVSHMAFVHAGLRDYMFLPTTRLMSQLSFHD